MTSPTLAQLLRGDRLATAAGAHNPLTAYLVAEAGFDVVWASGLEISASMGVPDANVLSVSECLATAAAMSAKVDIPVLADCDSGFGGIGNVVHMVRAYESAGVSGVCIEDKTFPKLNSFVAGAQHLVPVEDFAGKIAAAVATRSSADFVVVARIEALIAGYGMEEALRRARAYELAGADALLIHSKRSTPDEVTEFCARYTGDLPVVAVPTTYADTTMDQLHAAGVSLAIYANHGLRSAISSTRETLGAILRERSASGVEPRLASLSDVFRIQDTTRLLDDESRFEAVGRAVAAEAEAGMDLEWATADAADR